MDNEYRNEIDVHDRLVSQLKGTIAELDAKLKASHETIETKTDLKINVKKEDFGKFEACEQVGIDLITKKDFNYPSAKSEFFNMKTKIKIEIKEESFERIEAREQGGIEFITTKDFDHSFNESEFSSRKMKVKTEIKTEVK